MTLLHLAWRNLRRNKRRTLLTSIALTIGLIALINSRGMLNGIDQQSLQNLIDYDVAYGKGFAKGYLDTDFPGLDYTFQGADSLARCLSLIKDVTAATPRLEMTGMLIYKGNELPVKVVGVDPLRDKEVFKTLSAVVDGQSLTSDNSAVLVGDLLAGDMSLAVGDMVTVLVRSAPGALNPKFLPVSGIIASGHPKVDQFSVFLPLSTAREMALLPDSATEIAIQNANIRYADRIIKKLRSAYPELEWHTWDDLARDFLAYARLKRMGSGIVISIFALLAAVGVANTMAMAVHERTREIGTLRAMGFSSSQIGKIFIYEGLLIGVISGTFAVIIGSTTISILGIHGISLAMWGDMDIGYPVRDAIYPTIKVSSLIWSFIFGIAISLLASWGAARRAASGEVVRALREGIL